MPILKFPQTAAPEQLNLQSLLGTTTANGDPVLPLTHSLHFRVHTRVLLTLLVALAAAAVLWAEPSYRGLMREAGEAQKAGNLPLLIEKLEAVRAQRPDYPRVLLALVRAHTAAGKSDPQALDRAIAVLSSVAARGLAFDPAKDPSLAPLSTHPEFPRLAAELARNAAPRGQVATAQTLPAQSGVVESAVVDSQGRWYFGDVRLRCIWKRGADGALVRFTKADAPLLGVFGLAVDNARGVLWAGVSAVEITKDLDAATEKGRGYLAEFDLETGALLRRLDLPASPSGHVLGSLRLDADGTLYATDSTSPVIWRVAPGATRAEAWIESPEFMSLQGLAFSADRRTLFVSDYANGLWAIDVAAKQASLLKPADDSMLFGIDDLQRHGDSLVGVQNGVTPLRIVRLRVTADTVRTEVLAQGREEISDAATGSIVGGAYLFIGNSGWAIHEGAKTEPPPRDVRLISLQL